jgi:hypothetical protein
MKFGEEKSWYDFSNIFSWWCTWSIVSLISSSKDLFSIYIAMLSSFHYSFKLNFSLILTIVHVVDDFTLAICPGIGNTSESVYIRTFVHYAQCHGYRCAVLNHVGALDSVKVTAPRIFTYGKLLKFLHPYCGATAQVGPCPPLLRFLNHTHTHTIRHTVGLLWTSDQTVAEASTYIRQYDIKHKIQIFMPSAGFEPATPATKRPLGSAI